jgi:hypothetical protein
MILSESIHNDVPKLISELPMLSLNVFLVAKIFTTLFHAYLIEIDFSKAIIFITRTIPCLKRIIKTRPKTLEIFALWKILKYSTFVQPKKDTTVKFDYTI